MATKITKRENFGEIATILEGLGRKDLVDVINHEIELLDKKKANAKMTKTQEGNEVIKALILEELARVGTPITITELIKGCVKLNEMTNGSNQKVSALMTQLKDTQKVVRTQEGKKALFTIAPEEVA